MGILTGVNYRFTFKTFHNILILLWENKMSSNKYAITKPKPLYSEFLAVRNSTMRIFCILIFFVKIR